MHPSDEELADDSWGGVLIVYNNTWLLEPSNTGWSKSELIDRKGTSKDDELSVGRYRDLDYYWQF